MAKAQAGSKSNLSTPTGFEHKNQPKSMPDQTIFKKEFFGAHGKMNSLQLIPCLFCFIEDSLFALLH